VNHVTDYKKLALFDIAVVAMIVIGIALIILMVTQALPTKQKQNITSALNIFDIHEQFAQEMNQVKFVVYDVPTDYLNKFYVAFTQTATISSQDFSDLTVAGKDVYLAINQIFNTPMQGSVAGISIDRSDQTPVPSQIILPEINNLKVDLNQFTKL